MTKQKLKKRPAQTRAKRDYGLSSGEFLPRFNTNCKDGLAIARGGKEAVELECPVRVECDFAAVEVRLRKFENNKVVDGGAYAGGMVDDGFKATIIAPIFGSEPLDELGGVPLGFRSYESSAYSAREAFDQLDRQVCQTDVGPDQVPVIELQGFEKVAYGGRGAQRPVWEIVDWRPRRTEFKEYATERSIGVTYDNDADPNDEIPPRPARSQQNQVPELDPDDQIEI